MAKDRDSCKEEQNSTEKLRAFLTANKKVNNVSLADLKRLEEESYDLP